MLRYLVEIGGIKPDTRVRNRVTGILLFVSLMEHRAVVLADRSMAAKVDAEVRQEWVDLMIDGVKG